MRIGRRVVHAIRLCRLGQRVVHGGPVHEPVRVALGQVVRGLAAEDPLGEVAAGTARVDDAVTETIGSLQTFLF